MVVSLIGMFGSTYAARGRDAKAAGAAPGRGLAVAVLRHTDPRRGDAHADLLIEPAGGGAGLVAHDGSAGLWTLRLPLPGGDPAVWRGGATLIGVELAPHRWRYLRHQGPLDEPGRGRGSVRRLDDGVAWASRWGDGGVELVARLRRAGAWRLTLDRLAGSGEGARWRLAVSSVDRGRGCV